MKITVINGNMRKGSTWNCKNLLLSELAAEGLTEVTEFSLPKDIPHFCNGCFACIYKGENSCPHAEHVQPIVKALLEADLIVLTSPVYGLDVSGQMKAFIDHLCFMWITHRPNQVMFDKVAVTITTTAGAGVTHATKTMKNSLNFWGVKKIHAVKNNVAAMSWDQVKEDKKEKISRDMKRLAQSLTREICHVERVSEPLFRRFMFHMMKKMMRKNTWNATDRDYWAEKGWI